MTALDSVVSVHTNNKIGGCRHSSVDSPAPTIMPPRVRVPSTPSMLLSFIVFVVYLSCEKNENKQKEAGYGPFFIQITTFFLFDQIQSS